jgi:PPM family protein phosphatase
MHLEEMIKKAGHRVRAEAERRAELRGMGCTLTVALIENGTLFWGQIGDSRLYLYRRSELRQITTDQNLAWSLVEAGQLTPEEARISPYRHLLAQCVGCRDCRPAGGALQMEPGDWVLLTTDGLHNELPAARFAQILTAVEEPEQAVRKLVQAALDQGGSDNVTAIVAALPA